MLIKEAVLRKIVREEIINSENRKIRARKVVNEGIIDWFKKKAQNVTIPSSVEQAIASSSEDCWQLFSAMKGFGTDEAKVNKVLNSRKSDLPTLYNEYNTFIKTLITDVSGVSEFLKGLSSAGTYTINKKINSSLWDVDLIGWLDADGMGKQAKTLHSKLKEENPKFKRVKPSGGEAKEFGDDEGSSGKDEKK